MQVNASFNRFVILPEHLVLNMEISPFAVRVYALIRRYSDWDTGRCRLTPSKLAGMLRVGVRRAQALLAELAQHGFAERRPGGDWYWLPHPPAPEELAAQRMMDAAVAKRSAISNDPETISMSISGPRNAIPQIAGERSGGSHSPSPGTAKAICGITANSETAALQSAQSGARDDLLSLRIPSVSDPGGSNSDLVVCAPPLIERSTDQPIQMGLIPSHLRSDPAGGDLPAPKARSKGPPTATEEAIRRGEYDTGTLRHRPDVLRVLVDVWAREIWHGWAGRTVEPTPDTRIREIRQAIEKHGRTPSGILEAFAGVPHHPWFEDTLGDRPAVEPRIAIGASQSGFAPYDDLREIAQQRRLQALKAANGTDQERDEVWKAACDELIAEAPEVERVHAEPSRGLHRMQATWRGITWFEFVPEGNALIRTQIAGVNALSRAHAAAKAGGRAMVERWPDSEDVRRDAKGWMTASTTNLRRGLERLDALRADLGGTNVSQ